MRYVAERRCLSGSSWRAYKRVSNTAFDAPVDLVKECLLVVAEDHNVSTYLMRSPIQRMTGTAIELPSAL